MKIYQVFDSYPLFYQPYIPPIIDILQNEEGMNTQIFGFNSKNEKTAETFVLPNYKIRKIFAKVDQIFNNAYRNLEYFEIKSIKENVDVIHLQHSFLFPKITNLLNLPKNSRPKVVITLRGGDTYIKPWLYSKWIDFYKNYGNKVDAFVVMSEDQKKYLNSKWLIENSRIHVIPISFGVGGGAEPKNPNLEVMKVISAFRMCWEKNIEGNLRTIKLLKEWGVPIQYEVYGNGPDTGQLYYLIDQYDLSDCVSYHGRIENDLLKTILPKFDLFLQLSHSESLGLSVVEAQSLGVPAIVSNRNGLPESIINGKTGFCIDPFDVEAAAKSMLSLWQDKKKYNSFSSEAINFVNSKFTISHEVEKLKRLYFDLAKN